MIWRRNEGQYNRQYLEGSISCGGQRISEWEKPDRHEHLGINVGKF